MQKAFLRVWQRIKRIPVRKVAGTLKLSSTLVSLNVFNWRLRRQRSCCRQLGAVIICLSAVKSLKRYWNNWEHSTQREDPTPFPFLFLPIMSACRAAWTPQEVQTLSLLWVYRWASRSEYTAIIIHHAPVHSGNASVSFQSLSQKHLRLGAGVGPGKKNTKMAERSQKSKQEISLF